MNFHKIQIPPHGFFSFYVDTMKKQVPLSNKMYFVTLASTAG